MEREAKIAISSGGDGGKAWVVFQNIIEKLAKIEDVK
jgi:hypothetical protein